MLGSSLDTGSPEYLANAGAQLVLLQELAAELDKARAGGGKPPGTGHPRRSDVERVGIEPAQDPPVELGVGVRMHQGMHGDRVDVACDPLDRLVTVDG